MLKVRVEVVPVHGSKGPGYLASCEGASAYHPSYDVALALLHGQLVEAVKPYGLEDEFVLIK